MQKVIEHWDYLIVTASNEAQARAYEKQLRLRRDLGLLACVREVLVLPDPGGKRIGSGGSTLCCLVEVLNRELERRSERSGHDAWQGVFEGLRILIIHAGGDSQRLPSYGPCGKLFIPLPGENDSCLPVTLFDRQLPTYVGLESPAGMGQVIVTSGDVLLGFESAGVRFAAKGVTALACHATPEQAKRHGVFCRGERDQVRLFLQKPSLAVQQETGAIDAYDRASLDIGVMNLAPDAAVTLLKVFGAGAGADGRVELTGPMGEAVFRRGLDLYREICCAMGSEATFERYAESVRQSGSSWGEGLLRQLSERLSKMPFYVKVLVRCDFLHFGTSYEIIGSGGILIQQDRSIASLGKCLSINNEMSGTGQITGANAWVEGCRVDSSLTLGGENVIVGADISRPLSLPARMCLDVLPGRNRAGGRVWFVRCYDVHDRFNDPVEGKATLCGAALGEWLEAVGAGIEEVWEPSVPPERRTLWNARVFPAVGEPGRYHDWLWMFEPSKAGPKCIEAWHSADRYSCAEIATLADQDAFHKRRDILRAREIQSSMRKMFNPESEFSSAELAYVIKGMEGQSERSAFAADLLDEARRRDYGGNGRSMESLVFPRMIHALGSALSEVAGGGEAAVETVLPGLRRKLCPATKKWLDSAGLGLNSSMSVVQWGRRARKLAFESLGQVIISSGGYRAAAPQSALRSDEIVWGRAPARLDTGGGWTDTPPYSLEYGGCVVNTAVNLNGQVPIQVYARVIDEPLIRIGSIDLGTRIEISSLGELLDYREPESEYALAKAAIALSGFSHETADWPKGATLRRMLELFGGGIELTTLAAIPKGSGLGTSSIMGAVVIAVIQRVCGRVLTHKELFHTVLRLEQSLTTGGGWQDQIGGAVGGTKVVTTEPGLVPDARIHYLPADVLDPKANGGQTVLYYTGITRLAKNILEQVVGGYLNRDRATMSTLKQIHSLALQVAEALSRKDIRSFGRLVDSAWQLNKQLDPNSTNDQVEALLARVRPHVFGAKLLGAGGGGFMLMVCKTPEEGRKVRTVLEAEPVNARSRLFDFGVNMEGLVVTVC
ncbi:MAG: hypothetical protein JSU94_05345 [Phycisphaerales bacterium]|nr:MAG: hypothetical protein JSU94_05345 [Phycisphaerales bacterium]